MYSWYGNICSQFIFIDFRNIEKNRACRSRSTQQTVTALERTQHTVTALERTQHTVTVFERTQHTVTAFLNLSVRIELLSGEEFNPTKNIFLSYKPDQKLVELVGSL
jgi:hypothetical protein